MTPQAPLGLHHCRLITAVVVGSWLMADVRPALAQSGASPLPSFDFRQTGTVAGWGEPHDVSHIEATKLGMAVHIDGPDPYILGPAREYPAGTPLLLKIRLKSSEGGSFQVFYFGSGQGSSEEHSVRFAVRRGDWHEQTVPLPPLAPGFRLRLDPPGERGVCLIESIRFTQQLTIAAPAWLKSTVPEPIPGTLTIQSGALVLRQHPHEWGGFIVAAAGRRVATGHNRPLIGYLDPASSKSAVSTSVRWLDLAAVATVTTRLDPAIQALSVEAQLRDPDGGQWRLRQVFRPGSPAVIDVYVECSVDAPRDVVFLPLLLLLPGHGSFGALKGQALFAGVEYLENEPSSSTADLIKPGADRRVPASVKITFPLMAVQAHGHYVGLIWDRAPELCALFDSPDRLFGTEGHVLGLLAPGAEGASRIDGELFPLEPLKLAASRPVKASATIIGGNAASVVPAVMQYVGLKGLPQRPMTLTLPEYVRLTASGWLDSPIRSGHRFRHAVGGSFGAHPAADAAWMMDVLAVLCTDPVLADRLKTEAAAVTEEVPVEERLHAAVGHNRYPVAPLVLGTTQSSSSSSTVAANSVVVSLDQARGLGKGLAHRFEPDGSIRYRVAAGDTDYGRTHFCDEASGLSGESVFRLLEAGVYAGDLTTVEEGLRLLWIMHRRFEHGVPRGAQTWEIPLHTPDILGSAYLVKAFALGYELTGDPELLNAARYWAWTGVPFVYLVNPTDQSGRSAVGPYATIPVLGATNWVAPNWIGLPVQWCGLVYADGLVQLAGLDPCGPWRTLAEGIATSGISQTYPQDHPHHGLLPDSFNLSDQSRNPADINPGTLQPLALRLLAGDRPAAIPYTFHAFRSSGLWVHAPGAVEVIRDRRGLARFTVKTWSPWPSFVVIHGLHPEAVSKALPVVRLDGQPIALNPPHLYLTDHGTLILGIKGDKPVEVEVEIDH